MPSSSTGGGGGGGGGGNPGSPNGPGDPNDPGSPGGPDEPEPAEVLGLQIVAPPLSTAASAEVGGDCTGLALLGLTTIGCAPDPDDGLLTIRTSGLLGENEIGL